MKQFSFRYLFAVVLERVINTGFVFFSFVFFAMLGAMRVDFVKFKQMYTFIWPGRTRSCS